MSPPIAFLFAVISDSLGLLHINTKLQHYTPFGLALACMALSKLNFERSFWNDIRSVASVVGFLLGLGLFAVSLAAGPDNAPLADAFPYLGLYALFAIYIAKTEKILACNDNRSTRAHASLCCQAWGTTADTTGHLMTVATLPGAITLSALMPGPLAQSACAFFNASSAITSITSTHDALLQR